MRLTDWLGNEYGVGDTIIYPVMSSRSVEMQQAIVLDIWIAYQCPEDHTGKRLKEGEPVPTKEEFYWERTGDIPVRVSKGHKPVDTDIRVRLQPDGKGSRGFYTRRNSETIWVDPDGNDIDYDEMKDRLEAEHGPQFAGPGYPHRWMPRDFGYTTRTEAVTPKSVTLTQGVDNITFIQSK